MQKQNSFLNNYSDHVIYNKIIKFVDDNHLYTKIVEDSLFIYSKRYNEIKDNLEKYYTELMSWNFDENDYICNLEIFPDEDFEINNFDGLYQEILRISNQNIDAKDIKKPTKQKKSNKIKM